MPDGLDPSIILGPSQQAQQNGPLNALVAAAQTGNTLYNFQKQGADVLAGQDFQKAIGPNGQLDVPNFNRLIASQPGAALAAIQSGQDAQTNQSTQLSNQNAQIQNALARTTFLGNLMTGYAENPPTMKQFQSDIAGGIKQGVIDASTAANILSIAPDPSSPEFGPFAKSEAQHLSAAIGQISRFLPAPAPVSGPGGTVIADTNPLSPAFTAPGAVITPGVSPTTPVFDPATGASTYASPAPPQILQPGQPGGVAAQITQQVPPTALGGGTYPGNGPAAPPPASPGGSPIAGQMAGAPLGAGDYASASAQAYAGFQQNVSNAPGRIFALENAYDALSGANTGPGSDGRNEVLSYAQSLAGQSVIPGISADSIKNYDLANKYLTAYALQRANGYGAGTDEQLATALSANASTHISNLAAKDVVAANIALERMDQTAALLAQQQNVQPGQFLQWKSAFGTQVDPRAFAFPTMDRDDQTALIAKLKKTGALSKFAATLRMGMSLGTIQPPGQSNGGQ